MKGFVMVDKMAHDNNLILLEGKPAKEHKIYDDMISRVGLEFAGYFDYFDSKRLILIGSKDANFLGRQDELAIRTNVERIFKSLPPCVVFSKNVIIDDIFLEMSRKYNVPMYRSNLRTTTISSKLYTYLQERLAERISVHGTLMDINGMGTLIIGKSGIGKSETALELINRGHQLVADDLVEILEKEPGNLIGSAPDILKQYMEIRGIGIVDVVHMYGTAAYRDRKMIRLVVELEKWDTDKYYDRLGLDNSKIKYFNTEITKVTIPVLPGRTVALLVESAAMNEKLKFLGYNAAEHFVNSVDANVSKKGGEE